MSDIATRVYPSQKTYHDFAEMKQEVLSMLTWFWPTEREEAHSLSQKENHLVILLVLSDQEDCEIEAGQITTRKEARDLIHAVGEVHPVQRKQNHPFPVPKHVPAFGLA